MAFGMALTFGTFGTLASAIGHLFHDIGMWWHMLLGVLMLLMALQLWGVISVIPHCHRQEAVKKGYIGADSGCFERDICLTLCHPGDDRSACSGGGIRKDGMGNLLLALYAVGHSILTVAAGCGYSAADRWIHDPKYERISRKLRALLAIAIWITGCNHDRLCILI